MHRNSCNTQEIIKINQSDGQLQEAVVQTLVRPKVPVKNDVCRNIVLRTVVTLVAVIQAIEYTQTLLAVDW